MNPVFQALAVIESLSGLGDDLQQEGRLWGFLLFLVFLRNARVFMEQESGSSGVNDIDNYSRRVLLGFSFRGVKTTGSKELRANSLGSSAERGNVKLVRGRWNGDFLDEFELFPVGAHDDIVDATSGAFTILAEHVPLDGGAVPKIFGNKNH